MNLLITVRTFGGGKLKAPVNLGIASLKLT